MVFILYTCIKIRNESVNDRLFNRKVDGEVEVLYPGSTKSSVKRLFFGFFGRIARHNNTTAKISATGR